MKFKLIEESSRNLKRNNLQILKRDFEEANSKYFIQHHLDGNPKNNVNNNVIYIAADTYEDAELIHRYIHYKRLLKNIQIPEDIVIYIFNSFTGFFERKQIRRDTFESDIDNYVNNLDLPYIEDEDKIIFMGQED